VKCVYLNVSRGRNPLPCDEIHVRIGNWGELSATRARDGRGKISISSFLVVISRRDDDKRSSAALSI
jgi:hypothetical protein